MRKVNIDKKTLERIYLIEKHSIKETAKILGVAVGTVYKYLKEYNIPIRITGRNIKYYEQKEDIDINSIKFREVIDGIVISDGCIGVVKRKVLPNRAFIRIEQVYRHKDFIRYL